MFCHLVFCLLIAANSEQRVIQSESDRVVVNWSEDIETARFEVVASQLGGGREGAFFSVVVHKEASSAPLKGAFISSAKITALGQVRKSPRIAWSTLLKKTDFGGFSGALTEDVNVFKDNCMVVLDNVRGNLMLTVSSDPSAPYQVVLTIPIFVRKSLYQGRRVGPYNFKFDLELRIQNPEPDVYYGLRSGWFDMPVGAAAVGTLESGVVQSFNPDAAIEIDNYWDVLSDAGSRSEMMWICAKTANGFKGSQELPETKVIVQASLSTATQPGYFDVLFNFTNVTKIIWDPDISVLVTPNTVGDEGTAAGVIAGAAVGAIIGGIILAVIIGVLTRRSIVKRTTEAQSELKLQETESMDRLRQSMAQSSQDLN